MRWTEASIESLCLAVTSGGTPSRSRSEYWENGTIPWLKTGELNDGIVHGAEEKITKEGLANSSAKIFPKNTVLMAMYGDGRTITTLSILGSESATNQACAAMIANPEVCDYRFLFQALRLHRHKLLSLVVAGAQRNLSLGIVKRFAFPVPDLPTQQRIAGILSAYDDLIENNRRRIGLLEQAARLLYREWFVHLRFPGHETTKIVDGLPEGWEKTTLGKHCPLIYGKALKAETRIDGPFDVYGSSGIVGTHNKALTTGPAIIVGRKGNVGSVYWARRGFWPIDTVYFVDPANSDFFTFFALQNIAFQNTDVAVPGLNRDYAHTREIKLPPKELIQSFNDRATVFLRQAELLSLQNDALTRARDLLLPRLMDGRIPV